MVSKAAVFVFSVCAFYAVEARQICGPHEAFQTCGTACEPTCSITEPKCMTICQEGCFCEDGYIRDSQNGKCISKETCFSLIRKDQKCPIGEKYSTCCEEECERICDYPQGLFGFRGQKKAESTSNTCQEGCFCAPGFFRIPSTGECVTWFVCSHPSY